MFGYSALSLSYSFLLSSESTFFSNLASCFSANERPPIPNDIENATATTRRIRRNAAITMLSVKFNCSHVIYIVTIIIWYLITTQTSMLTVLSTITAKILFLIQNQ